MHEDAAQQATLDLDAEAFEALVVAELDLLPDDMVEGLDNVVFVVEEIGRAHV